MAGYSYHAPTGALGYDLLAYFRNLNDFPAFECCYNSISATFERHSNGILTTFEKRLNMFQRLLGSKEQKKSKKLQKSAVSSEEI